jgi:hypothetical protein
VKWGMARRTREAATTIEGCSARKQQLRGNGEFAACIVQCARGRHNNSPTLVCIIRTLFVFGGLGNFSREAQILDLLN